MKTCNSYKASSSKTETGSPKDSNVTSDFVARVFDQWSNVLKSAGKPYVINMNGIYESKVRCIFLISAHGAWFSTYLKPALTFSR